jgi:hypothetical protein
MIAIKAESVEGTPETLTASEVVHPVYDADWTPEYQNHERNSTGASFAQYAGVTGERTATIKFTVELKGAGAASAPPCTAAGFLASGMQLSTLTYYPASGGIGSATVAMYEGDGFATTGKIFQIHGARGTYDLVYELGQIVRVNFTFQGVYNAPTDGTMLAVPVTSTFQIVPQSFFGTAVTFTANFGGAVTTLKVTSVKFNAGNTLAARKGALLTNGVFSFLITGRKPAGEFTFETEAVSTIDPFVIKTGDTLGAVTVVVNGGTNNTSTLSIVKAHVTDVKQGNADGIATTTVSFMATQDPTLDPTVAANTEYSIAFS